MPPNDAILRGLVWLFPPEQMLQDDEITVANPITFLKAVIQRDLRLPVAHSLTLFNVAAAYHNPQFNPSIPGSFYRDPFSDMIPRERIYEIWSTEPLIRIGNTQKTRSQCIASYSDTVKQQVAALRGIVWKFRTDMNDRLNFAARPLDIGVPFNFQKISEDGRLWYGWVKLEEAYKNIELRRLWSEEPEQLEACEILRFEALTAQTGNDLTYQVRPSSTIAAACCTSMSRPIPVPCGRHSRSLKRSRSMQCRAICFVTAIRSMATFSSARVRNLGIKEVVIAARSLRQNPYVERLVGSVDANC